MPLYITVYLKKNVSYVALVDSGTTGILFPSTIYHAFLQVFAKGGSNVIYITICGKTYQISSSDYFLPIEGSKQSILLIEQNIYDSDNAIILGDPFLRSVAAIFDLTNSSKPMIGLAQRNRTYTVSESRDTGKVVVYPVHKVMTDKKLRTVIERDAATNTTVISACDYENWIYLANITIGTPRQGNFRVILDTGSSQLAVLGPESAPYSTMLIILIVVFSVLVVILSLILIFIGFMAIKYYLYIRSRAIGKEYVGLPASAPDPINDEEEETKAAL